MKKTKTATRLMVISDLHLGGVEPYMMSQPQRLAAFIASLPQRLAPGEALDAEALDSLAAFLQDLCTDQGVRMLQPSYAEVCVNSEGQVTQARLEIAP